MVLRFDSLSAALAAMAELKETYSARRFTVSFTSFGFLLQEVSYV